MEQNLCLKMEKLKKNSIEFERDRISNLPDSILHHIFTFLNIHEAVQSRVLSKRWRNLWTSLPTLNFNFQYPLDAAAGDVDDADHIKDYMEKNYALENLSSLFKASIDLTYYDDELLRLSLEVKKNVYAQRLLKFLRALHNVTDLTLSASILEVVSAQALLESNPIYRNLRSLRMDAPLSGDCIHTIICLLQMSPAIETLYINFKSTLIEENWEVELSSECLLNHLKRVEIRCAKGSVNELKFLETLLKNAVVLETLMIVFASTEVSVTDRETRFAKFGEKLRAFPKASSSITIILI